MPPVLAACAPANASSRCCRRGRRPRSAPQSATCQSRRCADPAAPAMQFGVQFFPDVRSEEKSAEAYFSEALDLAEEADRLGYTHIRIVEHYFHYYGGYSPNPIVFLAAAAQRTRRARLVTGAVLPAFNHPLKLAGEIAMLDAISGGRLDVGFARAFLPHEFRRFARSPDESVARFREGIEHVD